MSNETLTQIGLSRMHGFRQIFFSLLGLALAACPGALRAQSVTLATNAGVGFGLLVNGQGTVTPHVNGAAFAEGEKHSLTAVAAKGFLFANWMSNGAVASASPKYTFAVESKMILQADFVANPFTAGAYSGLFYATNDTTEGSSGSFAATVDAPGAFSAKLQMPGESHSFTGKFSLNGSAEKSIARPGLPALTVALQMNFSNNLLTGTISDGVWTAELAAMPAAYSKTNPAPEAGKYTLLIAGNTNASLLPGGNGFGSVVVSDSGAVAFSGTLGDGTPVVSASAVSAQGQWPLYSALYGGKGSILGWLSFSSNGLTGQTAWFKLAQSKSKLYSAGFTSAAEIIGSPYRHTNGAPVLSLTGGQVWLGGLIIENMEKLTFNTASGFFKGNVTNPVTSKAVSVSGAVLQDQNIGGGFFLGAGESESVFLVNPSTTVSPTNIFASAETNLYDPELASSLSSSPSNTNGSITVSTPNLLPVTNVAVTKLAPEAGRLAYWMLNDGSFAGDNGQMPISSKTSFVPAWCGTAVSMKGLGSSSQLQYNVFEANGQTNFNCTNGTIRFWFQPNWSTGSSQAPTNGGTFFQAGYNINGCWGLSVLNNGTNNGGLLVLGTASNQYSQPNTFQTGALNGVPVNFQSNMWYQIALTYSSSNIAIYTNGTLLATGIMPPQLDDSTYFYSVGNGISFYPSSAYLSDGFSFGCFQGQPCSINGQLAELEIFDHPLTPQTVAADFPTFAGATTNVMQDSDYDGRSDLLETLVDGTNPNNPNSVVQCRLGYWRFDSEAMQTEQGQPPLSWNDISLAPSWSGTGLYINNDPASQVTYWDVFTNGWANINCRQGCLRFWFKPNWTSAPKSSAPFVYVGNTNSAASQWALGVNSSGAITLTTASNHVTVNNLTSGPMSFDSGHWMQIVLNYGAQGTFLYTNGVLAATGKAVTLWPSLPDRNLGMVIGNTTAYNDSINGEFDEIETFNYELNATNISQNFQSVQSVDSDLDGVPDLLEDFILPASKPYLGSPVVITGTIEAEQFDLGGPGVAYQNVATNPACSYRPTGMFITNCDDMGLGYCLDQTRAGEWAQYTINVLVGQKYAIETRVAGIETNGVFECEFSNLATGFYTNTGPLTISSTNWTNITAVVGLTNGIYTMKLHFLTNGTAGYVGRFNYISIYPWWQAGFASTQTNLVSAEALSTNNDWADAVHNAAVIQSSINAIGGHGGGTVLLPAGTYFVSQSFPNETNNDEANAAISILTNNIEIAGAGKTNTTLVGYNRATTVISVGQILMAPFVACTNVTLRDITIEAQPHLAVSDVTNTTFELGQLNHTNARGWVGDMIKITGIDPVNYSTVNVLLTNCWFLYGDHLIGMPGYISNCIVCHCDFTVWGGTNFYTGKTNNSPTNTANTTALTGGLGVYSGGSPIFNLVIVGNNYNGNANLTPSTGNAYGYVNTNIFQVVAPDGFVVGTSGGNFFVARNIILNYSLEALQLTGGPNAVVGNTCYTLVNDPNAYGLAACNGGWQGATGFDPVNFSTCSVGNQIFGGRYGDSSPNISYARMYSVTVSGNYFALYPPLFQTTDYPGAAAYFRYCPSASITGNTLASGGHGVLFDLGCSNALIMNNNFANVSYRGIGLAAGGGSLQHAIIINNVLGQGVSFHIQLPVADSSGWFLYQNEYLNAASQSVPSFCDPISSSVHISD